MISTATLIEEDCNVLLERALLGKSICAFGEDGCGRFGKNDRASWFTIRAIDNHVCFNDSTSEITGVTSITLDNYDSLVTGHIMTDKNFEISLRSHLKAVSIDPDCLTWQTDLRNQGISKVVMDIDLDLLLDWK